MEDLETALHRDNPAMLEINRAIAQAAEQSHKVAKLQAGGLLDTDTGAARMAALDTKLRLLRADRRKLLQNSEIDEAIETLRMTLDFLERGPERLEQFDAGLFSDLVEKIVAESQTRVRFCLYGGLEFAEQLREVRR